MAWLLRNIFLFRNWASIYRGNTSLELRNGLKLSISSKQDIPTLYEVFGEHVYDSLFQNLKKEPQIILDIGANLGAFSLAAKKRYPEAKIYAYEASRDNFLKLKKNIEDNNLQIECFNLAVAGTNAPRSLFLADTTGKNSFFGQGEREEVRCITLDEIISNLGSIDLLKMDIEGAEEEVLTASHKLQNIKRIALEFHSNKDKVLPVLSQAGFVPISELKHGVQVFSNAQ
jgi:FkbM family methyltransferase